MYNPDLQAMMKQKNDCENNPERSSTAKTGEYIFADNQRQIYEHLIT